MERKTKVNAEEGKQEFGAVGGEDRHAMTAQPRERVGHVAIQRRSSREPLAVFRRVRRAEVGGELAIGDPVRFLLAPEALS